MDHVVGRIKSIRIVRGLSHENMAKELGLTQVSYTKLENGKTKLTVDRLYQIADILEVDIAELLNIEHKVNMSQNNKDSSTGYLQKIETYYADNKEAYERLIAAKEEQITLLKAMLNK